MSQTAEYMWFCKCPTILCWLHSCRCSVSLIFKLGLDHITFSSPSVKHIAGTGRRGWKLLWRSIVINRHSPLIEHHLVICSRRAGGLVVFIIISYSFTRYLITTYSHSYSTIISRFSLRKSHPNDQATTSHPLCRTHSDRLPKSRSHTPKCQSTTSTRLVNTASSSTATSSTSSPSAANPAKAPSASTTDRSMRTSVRTRVSGRRRGGDAKLDRRTRIA